MDFITAVKTCFQKYFVFKGRARRSEFWWFYLFTIIGSIFLSLIDTVAFGASFLDTETTGTDLMRDILFSSPLSDIFSYLTIIPTLSAGSRRLHDTGKSGWLQLMPLGPVIPLVFLTGAMSSAPLMGALVIVLAILTLVAIVVLIIWFANDGHEDENRYGHSPKYGGIADTFD